MNRDPDWIRTYDETIHALYAYVSRRTGGDRSLSEDVTQEAWLRAVDTWRRAGPPDDPLAWLETVAANLLRNHFRRRRPEPLPAGELDLEHEDLGPATPRAAEVLAWGLARLRTEPARLLALHHLDGVAISSIATELGLSERAVEGRLYRAREALRRCLAPYYDHSSHGAPGNHDS